ncbi:hypothetical protein CHS0354_033059 [Potamilus streckersoni]|uniref:COR domain-containing protein n=1 Tax=Potamilus streckersoni TaxID=2493646 RepID=A0AAE0SR26_9BIVA|nr:hypothetical protein CHS0354_033059 [Potamilus streckersoni]
MSLELTDVVEKGTCRLDAKYVTFWLNSVHSHVRIPHDELLQREDTKTKCVECGATVQRTTGNRPCVILVGTHSDKIHKRKKAYFNAIRNVLKNSPLLLNIADDDFAISNLGSDPSINALKSKIFEVAQNQVYWGQGIPARWIPLSRALMEKRDSGIQVMDYEQVKNLNGSLQVSIKKPEELNLFLVFEHDMVNIVFFNTEKLKKIVVLDPQWLIHGVRTWITSDQVIFRHPELSAQWFDFTNTGKLTSTLIGKLWASYTENDKEHLLDVMDKLHIIAKPLHREESPYHDRCNIIYLPVVQQSVFGTYDDKLRTMWNYKLPTPDPPVPDLDEYQIVGIGLDPSPIPPPLTRLLLYGFNTNGNTEIERSELQTDSEPLS